ncbi:hypothetical protein V8F20_012049 [Naviculisporaceae sp. PSN 640]
MFFKRLLEPISVLSGLLIDTGSATCVASPISVRLPPTFDGGASTATWSIPPIDWDWGYWYQTYSSSANTFQRNLHCWTMPVDPVGSPAGVREELASFQLTGTDSTIYTTYGLETPISPAFPFAWNYTGSGILSQATDFLEILAWGTDCNGVGYRVSHSTYTAFTNTPATLDILSRSVDGPDPITLANLQSALIGLGNCEITARAEAWVAALHDTDRDGLPPVETCDAQCQTNENLLPIIGP